MCGFLFKSMTEEKKNNHKERRRHERELAFQALFQIDFHDEKDRNDGIEAVLTDDGEKSSGYASYLTHVVLNNLADIDACISGYLKKGWTLKRLPEAEKTILRVACAEMRYLAQPKEISINEAVELAKRYAAENAPSYINGILNHMGRDLEANAEQ